MGLAHVLKLGYPAVPKLGFRAKVINTVCFFLFCVYLHKREIMKYNLKKKYQIAMRRAYATNTPSKEVIKLLGIDKQEFKNHIDKYLIPGMTLENFGKDWGLDHIVPVELFNLNSENETKVCYSYLNIIPMFNNDNRLKGASVHFSLDKLRSLSNKESEKNKLEIIDKLISKCEQEIQERYSKYII